MGLVERMNAYREALEGDFQVGEEAKRFVAMMRAEHPEELDEWMRQQAVAFVSAAFAAADKNRRRLAFKQVARQSFTEAGDDPAKLALFAQRFSVDAANTRRPLRDMTAKDLRYAASSYGVQGNRMLAVEAFLLALAKKTGVRKVGEVMNERECERLLASFLPNPALLAEVA